MRLNNTLHCNINSRTLCIIIGGLCATLWTSYACWISPHVLLPGYRPSFWMPETEKTALFLSSLASAAMSVLMIFGVMNKNVSYMLPWLAIHFATLLYLIPVALHAVGFHLIIEGMRDLMSIVIPIMLSTPIVIYSWVIVYRFCMNLVNSTQVQPTCPQEKGKVLG